MRRRLPAALLVVAVVLLAAFTAAGPAVALPNPNVTVRSDSSLLELELNSEASNIAVSGASDGSVTIAELSSSGPVIAVVAAGGSTCLGGGTRTVTCETSTAFPALTVLDNGVGGPADRIDASASPVLVSMVNPLNPAALLTSPTTIVGSPQSDTLRGSDGADSVNSVDGHPDRVDCGGGVDEATVDPADTIVNCELATVYYDADKDGYFATEDCDDKDPGVNPGAREIPGNGRDDDCDGKDDSPAIVYVDADKDGIAEPEDCDDRDAKIRPGALEIVGNEVDENCDRVVAPFPPIGSSVHATFGVKGPLTKVVDLTVSDVPQGARLALKCRTTHLRGGGGGGGGCAFSKESFSFPRGPRQSVDLSASFGGKKIKPGVVITVTISAPQMIGRQVQYKTRKAKEPVVSSVCVQPEGRVDSGFYCGNTDHF